VPSSIAHQPIQQCAEHVSRLAFDHGGVKTVNGFEQHRVLIVDGFDPDR